MRETRKRDEIAYPNLLSRLIAGPAFRRQFILPELPDPRLERFLRWYERTVLDIDLTPIYIDRPIFLVGLPRSGTSMLQDVICTHPRVAYITNTMHQFRRCFCAAEDLRRRLRLNARGERYLGDSVVVDAGSPNDAIAFWGEWLRQDPVSLDYVERTIEHFSPGEIEEIRRTIRKILWCFGPTPHRFFSKNPGFLPYLSLLKDLFPDARFLHIVRDPRMTANSMVKLYRIEQRQLARLRRNRAHGILEEQFIPYPRLPNLKTYVARWGPDDIRTTAHLWRDAVKFVGTLKARLPSFLEVRYEDILEDPPGMLSRIFAFCGLEEPGPNDVAYRRKLEGVGKIHHTNRYGQFERIEAICGEVMARYGYLQKES